MLPQWKADEFGCFGGRWCSGGQLSFTPQVGHLPHSFVWFKVFYLTHQKNKKKKNPGQPLALASQMSLWETGLKVQLGQRGPATRSGPTCCFNSWRCCRGQEGAVKKRIWKKKRPHLFALNSGRTDHWGKWAADEQNLPLGPCGSLQLLSPASSHLTQPRSPSPFISTVALLHVCCSVFLSEETWVFSFVQTSAPFWFLNSLSFTQDCQTALPGTETVPSRCVNYINLSDSPERQLRTGEKESWGLRDLYSLPWTQIIFFKLSPVVLIMNKSGSTCILTSTFSISRGGEMLIPWRINKA